MQLKCVLAISKLANEIDGNLKQVIWVEMLKITLEPIWSTICHTCSLLKITLLTNGAKSLEPGHNNRCPSVEVSNSRFQTLLDLLSAEAICANHQ